MGRKVLLCVIQVVVACSLSSSVRAKGIHIPLDIEVDCNSYSPYTDILCDTLHQDVPEIEVKARRLSEEVKSLQPIQRMDREQMERLGIQSVADAVRRFAGTTVRDYGGIGGLKSVSVRSLGVAHTAVTLDGVTVSNCQAGQIDVGRFSMDNIEELSLAVGQSNDLLQSARGYASAGILNIRTQRPLFVDRNEMWRVQLYGGSFGYVTPSLRYARIFGQRTILMVDGNYMRADGIYPFRLENGKKSTTEHRNNSDIYSWQVETNLFHTFRDYSKLETKVHFYQSERGLPGGVILYNPTSNERLWDENFFVQAVYDKTLSSQCDFRATGKYNHSWNRYEDSNVKYPGGKQVDTHRQNEYALTAAFRWKALPQLTFSLAQDAVFNKLRNNIDLSPNPLRFSSLTAINAIWRNNCITTRATLVGTWITDKVYAGKAPDDRKAISPSMAFTWRPFSEETFYLRAMYKNTFRVPSFNDLYYRRMGNIHLKPEDATEYNVGMTWEGTPVGILEKLALSVDAYYNKVKNKIVAFPSVYIWRMANFGKVDIKGLDVTLASGLRFSDALSIDISAAYSFQTAIDMTDSKAKNYKAQIPYTPRHNGNLSCTLNTPWLELGYSFVAVGERYFLEQNIPANLVEDYVEHSLILSRSFKWSKVRMKLQGEWLNFTDEQYEVIRYYPMPGRSWRVKLRMEI